MAVRILFMWFGQLVIGPPGAGKSTYCHGLHQLLTGLGRSHVTVNLDPANDNLTFTYDIDIRDLVDIEIVMKEVGLGPNGGLMYSIDYLLENFDWLANELKKFPDRYVIMDFPGQVELYTNHFALKTIVDKINKMDCRLTAVHLVDCTLCLDPQKYMSAVMVALNAMMLLEMPHVNLMSKVDLLKALKSEMHLPFQTFVDADDFDAICRIADSVYPQQPRLRKLQRLVGELVEDFSLVKFLPLDVHDKKSMIAALKRADTANGLGVANHTLKGDFEFALQTTETERQELIDDVQERYIDDSDEEIEG